MRDNSVSSNPTTIGARPSVLTARDRRTTRPRRPDSPDDRDPCDGWMLPRGPRPSPAELRPGGWQGPSSCDSMSPRWVRGTIGDPRAGNLYTEGVFRVRGICLAVSLGFRTRFTDTRSLSDVRPVPFYIYVYILSVPHFFFYFVASHALCLLVSLRPSIMLFFIRVISLSRVLRLFIFQLPRLFLSSGVLARRQQRRRIRQRRRFMLSLT